MPPTAAPAAGPEICALGSLSVLIEQQNGSVPGRPAGYHEGGHAEQWFAMAQRPLGRPVREWRRLGRHGDWFDNQAELLTLRKASERWQQ